MQKSSVRARKRTGSHALSENLREAAEGGAGGGATDRLPEIGKVGVGRKMKRKRKASFVEVRSEILICSLARLCMSYTRSVHLTRGSLPFGVFYVMTNLSSLNSEYLFFLLPSYHVNIIIGKFNQIMLP